MTPTSDCCRNGCYRSSVKQREFFSRYDVFYFVCRRCQSWLSSPATRTICSWNLVFRLETDEMKLPTRQKETVRIAAIAAAFVASSLSVSAQAEDPNAAYTMIAITDASYGRKVTSGRYEQAIERITMRRIRNSEFFESKTNLCVAYTKSGDLENASVACNDAIEYVRKRVDSNKSTARIPIAQRINLAAALTNRGVLHAVTGKHDLARRDFVEADSLRSGLSAPKASLARLESADSSGI